MWKVMVSLPEELVRQIDAEARRRSTTRSGLLAQAAREMLQRPDLEAAKSAVERSRRRFATSGAHEAADLVRADRDRSR